MYRALEALDVRFTIGVVGLHGDCVCTSYQSHMDILGISNHALYDIHAFYV